MTACARNIYIQGLRSGREAAIGRVKVSLNFFGLKFKTSSTGQLKNTAEQVSNKVLAMPDTPVFASSPGVLLLQDRKRRQLLEEEDVDRAMSVQSLKPGIEGISSTRLNRGVVDGKRGEAPGHYIGDDERFDIDAEVIEGCAQSGLSCLDETRDKKFKRISAGTRNRVAERNAQLDALLNFEGEPHLHEQPGSHVEESSLKSASQEIIAKTKPKVRSFASCIPSAENSASQLSREGESHVRITAFPESNPTDRADLDEAVTATDADELEQTIAVLRAGDTSATDLNEQLAKAGLLPRFMRDELDGAQTDIDTLNQTDEMIPQPQSQTESLLERARARSTRREKGSLRMASIRSEQGSNAGLQQVQPKSDSLLERGRSNPTWKELVGRKGVVGSRQSSEVGSSTGALQRLHLAPLTSTVMVESSARRQRPETGPSDGRVPSASGWKSAAERPPTRTQVQILKKRGVPERYLPTSREEASALLRLLLHSRKDTCLASPSPWGRLHGEGNEQGAGPHGAQVARDLGAHGPVPPRRDYRLHQLSKATLAAIEDVSSASLGESAPVSITGSSRSPRSSNAAYGGALVSTPRAPPSAHARAPSSTPEWSMEIESSTNAGLAGRSAGSHIDQMH